MADLIVVIDDGNISEFGTHLELMALPGGLYAELFSLQAQQYQWRETPGRRSTLKS